MKEDFSIKVTYTDGGIITFKEDAAANFQFMQGGLFFVEGMPTRKIEEFGKIKRKVEYRSVRTWIPVQQIKNVEIITKKTLTEPKEIEKWEKFLEHGLDLMMTKISHTQEPTEAEIQRKIDIESGKITKEDLEKEEAEKQAKKLEDARKLVKAADAKEREEKKKQPN